MGYVARLNSPVPVKNLYLIHFIGVVSYVSELARKRMDSTYYLYGSVDSGEGGASDPAGVVAVSA